MGENCTFCSAGTDGGGSFRVAVMPRVGTERIWEKQQSLLDKLFSVPVAPQPTENHHKINTAVTFSYLWLFLTYKCCIYRTFFYTFGNRIYLFLCPLFFFVFFCCFVSNEYLAMYISSQEAMCILKGYWSLRFNIGILSLQPYLCPPVPVPFHHGDKVPLQTDVYSLY